MADEPITTPAEALMAAVRICDARAALHIPSEHAGGACRATARGLSAAMRAAMQHAAEAIRANRNADALVHLAPWIKPGEVG